MLVDLVDDLLIERNVISERCGSCRAGIEVLDGNEILTRVSGRDTDITFPTIDKRDGSPKRRG